LSINKIYEIGFLDPFRWRIEIWIIISKKIIIGNKKCIEKNRFKVGLETENPPQIQITIVFPK